MDSQIGGAGSKNPQVVQTRADPLLLDPMENVLPWVQNWKPIALLSLISRIHSVARQLQRWCNSWNWETCPYSLDQKIVTKLYLNCYMAIDETVLQKGSVRCEACVFQFHKCPILSQLYLPFLFQVMHRVNPSRSFYWVPTIYHRDLLLELRKSMHWEESCCLVEWTGESGMSCVVWLPFLLHREGTIRKAYAVNGG